MGLDMGWTWAGHGLDKGMRNLTARIVRTLGEDVLAGYTKKGV